MTRRITARELANTLPGSRLSGDPDRQVTGPNPIDEASGDSVAFCSKTGAKGVAAIRQSQAGVIVCAEDIILSGEDCSTRTLIQVSNPRLAFIRLVKAFFAPPASSGIHPGAVIDPRARLAASVSIGPHTYVGECTIGEGSIIHGNTYIYPRTRIGKNVIIKAGSAIGGEGFGYERNERGEWEKFPQLGGVVIEDNVEIGSSVSIDRGTMGDTIIGVGTKIDNLCHIAHNVVIGKHCLIIALSMIGGSTTIGDYSYVAPSAAILNKIKIGRNVLIGMGAVVIQDVPDNTVVAGVPARTLRDNAEIF